MLTFPLTMTTLITNSSIFFFFLQCGNYPIVDPQRVRSYPLIDLQEIRVIPLLVAMCMQESQVTLALQHEFSVLGLTRQLLVMMYIYASCVLFSAFGEQVLFGRLTYLGRVEHFGGLTMELVKIFPINCPPFHVRPFCGQATKLRIFFHDTWRPRIGQQSHCLALARFFSYKQGNFPFKPHSFSKFQFKAPSELVQLSDLCSYVSYSFDLFMYGSKLPAHLLI